MTELIYPQMPENSLVVLIGPSGAGKTTIANTWPASQVLSLDALRETVSDDAGDQEATGDAVAALHLLLEARMRRRLFTVIDATNVTSAAREPLIAAAKRHDMLPIALMVATPGMSTCLARQDDRPPNRRVPPQIVAGQHAAMPSREQLLAEGWDQVHDAADLDLPTTVATATASADARAVWDRLNPIERDGLVSILRTVLSAPDLGAEILALADRHPAR